MTTPELRAALGAADKAFRTWQRVPLADRAVLVRRAGALLRERAEQHARLMSEEMGKPIRGARAEVEKSAWACDHYAEHAAAFLADEAVETDAGRSFVAYRPLGPVLAIMPWNFPYWQIFRVAAPGLMAGNVILLKHAANVPGCALAIEAVFRDAGFPEGTFRTLLIDHAQLRTAIRHKAVRAVTLTGSTAAGRLVAKQAGERLKKTVLELGGSDPYLILADADLDLAVEACATSRLINSGQSCIAAKRFVVVDAVREEFERRLVERMGRAKVGNQLADDTDVGPLARVDLRDTLHRQVGGERGGGGAGAAGRERSRRPRRVLSADRAHRRGEGDAGLRRGAVRPGGRRSSRCATRRPPSRWPTTRCTGSAPRSSRATSRRAPGSPPRSWRRAPPSSTPS